MFSMRSIGLLGLCLLCTINVFGQYNMINSKSRKIKFKLVNNIVIIPVELNGVTLSFVLDTGVTKAILFDIGLTCVGQIYTLCPVEFRESYLIRNLIVNPFALGVLFALGYSCVLILLGRYPKFPVFTDAARLHALSGRLDI